MVKLRYELSGTACSPIRATPKSVGFDLSLPRELKLKKYKLMVESLDIKFEIPEGYYLRMEPRSSLLIKFGIIMPVGIIDNDYRKYVHAILYPTRDIVLSKGQRICQVILTAIEPCEVLPQFVQDSDRGGLGSTGI